MILPDYWGNYKLFFFSKQESWTSDVPNIRLTRISCDTWWRTFILIISSHKCELPYVYRIKSVIESVTNLPLLTFKAAVQLHHLYFHLATHDRATSILDLLKHSDANIS